MKNLLLGTKNSTHTYNIIFKDNLQAPYSYWSLQKNILKSFTNGCGSKGILNYLVPDNLIGTNITSACNIHDYMYLMGQTTEERKSADKIFLKNMKAIINKSDSSFFVKTLRKIKAHIYYWAVRIFGQNFFGRKKIILNKQVENI